MYDTILSLSEEARETLTLLFLVNCLHSGLFSTMGEWPADSWSTDFSMQFWRCRNQTGYLHALLLAQARTTNLSDTIDDIITLQETYSHLDVDGLDSIIMNHPIIVDPNSEAPGLMTVQCP